MAHTQTNFGIVTERGMRRFTIFDTDNLTVLHQINTPSYDYIDVAITSDCSRAVLSAFNDERLVQVDLTQDPPQVIDDAAVPLLAEDVALTPDNNFAVVTNGLTGPTPIISYSLLNETIAGTVPNMDLQAVAVSPNGNGLVLAAEVLSDVIRILTIDNTGNLTDSGITVATGGLDPINITFHPTGNFAFVPNLSSSDLSVFDTAGPTTLLATIPTNTNPQTIVVTRDGNTVFVLTDSTVDVFTFTPSAPFLTPAFSFPHGLPLNTIFFGVEIMALDATQTKLFISSVNSNTLAAFTTDGTPLGTVPGVVAEGGVATCLPQPPTIICHDDITVFNDLGRNGAFVNFPDPTVTGGVHPINFSCSPASGSFFPRGTTTVTCTATDALGNTSSCSFNIKVIVDPCRFFSGR